MQNYTKDANLMIFRKWWEGVNGIGMTPRDIKVSSNTCSSFAEKGKIIIKKYIIITKAHMFKMYNIKEVLKFMKQSI